MLDKIKKKWRTSIKNNSDKDELRKKALIILITIILAFLLWLVVNLNRDYTIDIQVPVRLGQVSAEKALVEKLPKTVTANVSGEGWDLLSTYRNPPTVSIEVSGRQVNMFKQVRRKVQASTKLTVQTVDPLYLNVRLQEKKSKKVPVVPRVEVNFVSQYGFLESPHIKPDSVIITGAKSIIEGINFWLTDSLKLSNIKHNVSVEVSLRETGQLIKISQKEVQFTGEVVQFTEGEVTVPVEIINYRYGQNVIFSPSSVKITYLAPIKEFPKLEEKSLFEAYITYSALRDDTTGYIAPRIDQIAKEVHLKVQQVRPPQVAYFNVVTKEQ